ncbi:thioredoxin reductase [Bifidobacterium sp. DSM 109958]|uniref:Thioredoxin reductase n=1 Tax=Bifidobacterium moraviense TaxID=2675323 RepID=A0A7Y0F2X4_9BIFI|nr:thioredoxin-disulfide reductase [Bifidobacterium sp. DSM 109958]NMN01018.1 thioredoxin reductase [Bifidobacterium sp. DSM 109958]
MTDQQTDQQLHDVIIIGSGPAGYTAAIYLGRAGHHPLVVTGALAPGGQLVNTTEVENFPGFPDGVLGPELMDRMREQAERFGAELLADDVVSVIEASGDNTDNTDGTNGTNAERRYEIELSSGESLQARAVIIATGSSYRKLGVPGEQEFYGRGVSYCATCDGFFFRDKPIIVVGGGDSAMEEALFLTRFGSSVTLIHRRDAFRASSIMVDRVKADPKITVLTNTIVTEIHGEDADDAQNAGAQADAIATPSPTADAAPAAAAPAGGLKLSIPGLSSNALSGLTNALSLSASAPKEAHVGSVSIRNTVTGETGTLPVAGLFVAIGHTPATEFATDCVRRDDDGYILVDGASTRTSAPGVFAAGDCVDRTYRQAISAAGMGCRAALDAQAYLAE